MIKLANSIKGNRNLGYKLLQWNIINHCNYKCPYCIVGVHEKKYETCENWYDIISFLNIALKSCKFKTIPRLYGGEPTLHPYISQICKMFEIPYGMYTNLSKPIDFWESILQYKNFKYIYCSFHAHASNIEEFEKKLDYIDSKSYVHMHINIMLESKYLEELEKLFKTWNKKYLNHRVTLKIIDKFEEYSDINNLKKYLYDWQYYEFDNKITSRIDIVKNKLNNNILLFNNRRYICDINKYFNSMDIYGNLYNCVDSNSKIMSSNDNPQSWTYFMEKDKILCHNKTCCPYMFEYGTKKLLK